MLLKTFFRVFLFLVLTALPISAQSKILGNWEGILVAGPQKLKLIIHVSQDSSGLKGTLDSPDQGAFGIPMSSTEIIGDSLKVKNTGMGLTISAVYQSEKDSLYSDFMQGGAQFKMTMGRSTSVYKFNRPQLPKEPFPYKIEEVTFINKNADGIKLAGTFTIPDNVKNPPAVILISGSGPQDRDEKIMEHQPFLVIADYLSRNGIAVLRYDDRGVAKSEGNFGTATSYDFSTDAEAALEYLRTRKEINTDKIGLIGHSEGGMIAPMVASRNNNTAFIVLLAGPGITINKLMLKQLEDYTSAAGAPKEEIEKMLILNDSVFTAIRKIEDKAMLTERLREILKQQNYADGNKEQAEGFIQSRISPWFSYFIRFTPSEYLEKVKCPVLALNGELDKQVNAEMNLEGIRTALNKAENTDFTIQAFKGLNHLFQEATTGNESEYIQIEQTFSPQVMEVISKWILKRF